MQDYLIFRLHGPIASWGEIAVGGERHSYEYPTKSAIVGLIAAALGIKRDNESDLLHLQHNIGFAVRIDHSGKRILDYHTAQTPVQSDLKKYPHSTRRDETLVPTMHTVLSMREYYCDAVYTLVLWQRSVNTRFSLQTIQHALKYPEFAFYLGRKACPPALPIQACLVNAETILDALKIADKNQCAYEKVLFGLLKKPKSTTMQLYWDQDGKTGGIEYLKFLRKDALKSRRRWQYRDREENYQLLALDENEGDR